MKANAQVNLLDPTELIIMYLFFIGSRMVRELFVMAREHAPSIIFMDEIDSIGSSRIGSGSNGETLCLKVFIFHLFEISVVVVNYYYN